MKKFFILLLFLLVCGCLGGETPRPEDNGAAAACVLKCEGARGKENLSNGPCLSNEIKPDWVCDVAHSPRTEGDNKPENQCSAFREGKAHHFVEVTQDCGVIKVY